MQVQEAASIALLCLHGTCEFGILGTPLGKNGFRDKRACLIRDSRWGHGGCALRGMGRGGWVESSQAGGLSRGTAGRGMVGLDPARQIPHPTLAPSGVSQTHVCRKPAQQGQGTQNSKGKMDFKAKAGVDEASCSLTLSQGTRSQPEAHTHLSP